MTKFNWLVFFLFPQNFDKEPQDLEEPYGYFSDHFFLGSTGMGTKLVLLM